MQLKLGFLDLEDPAVAVWEQIDDEARKALVDALARTIAKVVCRQVNKKTEDRGHDR